MKMPRFLFAATIALALGGAATAADPALAVAGPKLAYGQMMKQGDRLVFAPCRDRSYVMVEDVSPGGMLTRALDEVGLGAGKKLYVELVGVVEGGALKASGVNLARTEGRCQQPGGRDEAWRAGGNEPGWALAVGSEVVVLKRVGEPDVHVPAGPVPVDNGIARFEAKTEATRLAFRFEQKLCRDTMADAVFGWTATVEVNGRVLKGCAWQR
jgi:putative lipoprotein